MSDLRFGRIRPQAFPDWCDTGKKTSKKLRHDLDEGGRVIWNVANDSYLPHYDHIEMTGQKVSSIVSYGVDEMGFLQLNRHVIFPTLRMIPNETRGSLTHNFPSSTAESIFMNGKPIQKEKVLKVIIDGRLTIESLSADQLKITRTMFPSMTKAALIEKVIVTNIGEKSLKVEIRNSEYYQESIKEESLSSFYCLEVAVSEEVEIEELSNGESIETYFIYSGRVHNEEMIINPKEAFDLRAEFLDTISENLVLETPDAVFNIAFEMAKWRAAESIINTKGGLMHAPGGGDYYAALWTNDQCEYVNPLFPFMGYELGIEQSVNAYKQFMRFMDPEFSKPLVSSIVAEGTDFWNGAGDRGDAAMYMYGAARFLLAQGNRKMAEEIWPGIQWCLEYSLMKINADGVVESDSDELENRFESGDANLFTSCLVYDGLLSVAMLAESMGIVEIDTKDLYLKAETLKSNIELYFGGDIEGYKTYMYYKGNDTLRSWICMPLVVGIDNRKDETISALYNSRLWTDDGLSTQAGEETFWDRSTLFAFRGTFISGFADIAYEHLRDYTYKRLLGEHVPYPVEAYPEGNQRHLSAESGLFVRIFTEGVLGIRPTGFDSFEITPQLPEAWPSITMRNIHICGVCFTIKVEKSEKKYEIKIIDNTLKEVTYFIEAGETLTIKPKLL